METLRVLLPLVGLVIVLLGGGYAWGWNAAKSDTWSDHWRPERPRVTGIEPTGPAFDWEAAERHYE